MVGREHQMLNYCMQ